MVELGNLNGYGYGHLAPHCGLCGPRDGWSLPDDEPEIIECPECSGDMYYAGDDYWMCADCQFLGKME